MADVSEKWRFLSGENKWKNLLEPLDIDLRRYLIHYGEMAQVTADTFNSEKASASKYAGDSRYSMENLFSRVCLEKTNPYKYNVTKYLYATSQIGVPESFILKSLSREGWCKESNWIGYVAVATDETKVLLGRRDVLVAWRGTIQAFEWIEDFDFPLVPADELFGEASDDVNVHRGWLSIYTSDDPRSHYNKTSARDQVLQEVKRLLEEYKEEEISITVTGHSMGASLGTLNAADIVTNIIKKREPNGNMCPVTAFLFGSPRVGDFNFSEMVNGTNQLHILRIKNSTDLVTYYPLIGYSDVGQELVIDTRKSNYLKSDASIENSHGLEVYLHGVAGTQGSQGEFQLKVNRDIALVNKALDVLKDEYLIPKSWWVVKNKGMVQEDDGFWKLDDHEE